MSKIARGHLFILSGPAGTGKTTLVQMATDALPHVVRSITCTTRKPRPGEVDGVDYFFLTKEEFKKKIEAGDFLEYANVFGNLYGTSRSLVEKELARGHSVILVIDTQGALQLKDTLEATLIFVSPPSLEELKKRLSSRGSETPELIDKRVLWARHELEMISHYDYHIINDKLSDAFEKLKKILITEGRRAT